MVRRQLLPMVMVVLLVVSCICVPGSAFSNSLKSNDYVGPGKHETELYIKTSPGNEKIDAGKVAMWNTREQFLINIETREDWQLDEISVYVGSDPIPMSEGGAPKINQFPYNKKFSSPVDSYELALDLIDDLNFMWGKRDKGERIQNIAVYAKLVGNDENGKQVNHEQAWAYGENEFESKWGWWTQYAMDHPKTGHFIDSPVAGMKFETQTNKGRTDDSGAFDYIEGEKVTLAFGNVRLGTATAQNKITPLDIVGTEDLDDIRVINMARLLQSLDVDAEPKRGITITETVTDSLEKVMATMEIEELDFSNSELIDDVIVNTVILADEEGIDLNAVSAQDARDNLEKGISSTIFRKNVSKTPEFINTKAKLELMPVYSPAKKANGDPVILNYYESVYDEENDTYTDVLSETRDVAKPLVAVYTDEVEGTGASDVFAAISRDEGETWQRKNLSKSADKSSFKLENGTEYPGDVRKPQVRVRNNNILVAWTSKYAKTGKPTYAIKIDEDPLSDNYYPYDDEYYEEDIWGVSGPQRSVDYTDEGYPEVGEIPFSVVWACRGCIDPETGDITWYKPERLTSGRRDAFQLMFTGAPDVGFALVWQEDPKGLRPGEQAGPGEGWSGATTNHKADIWYSYILWDDFQTIDENFVSKGSSQNTEELDDEEVKGRPKALVPFSLPIRVSDNDTVNYENMKAEYSGITQTDLDNMEEGETIEVEGGEWTPIIADDKIEGTHQYGYRIDGLCDQLYYKVNHQGANRYVAVTEDGRLLDGNTGASRPNIMMQPYTKSDGTKSGWVVICYEETKGVGAGPPEDTGSTNDNGQEQDESLTAAETTSDIEDIDLTDTNSQEQDGSFTPFSTYGDSKTAAAAETSEKGDNEDSSGTGSGAQRGKYTYVPDNGKNVIYHSFDIKKPDLVSAGYTINPQVEGEEGEPGVIADLQYLVDEEDNLMYDWQGNPIPAYENARRPRLLIQSKKGAIEGKEDDEKGTVLVMVYKMGEDGKGRPSDIFMRRWEVSKNDKGNPYAYKYMVKNENRNISSVTIGDTWINTDSDEDSKGDGIKVLNWTQTEENLMDTSWLNPYDDARAHRGILRGDSLAIAYDWTPNWAAARNGNDVFNLYVRRSFDGGKTFTTNPQGTNEVYIDGEYQGIGVLHTDTFKTETTHTQHDKYTVETFYAKGEYEPARNLSQIQNTKTSVIEPRLVGGPSTIKTDGEALFEQDKRDTNAFWVTFGTESNPQKGSEEIGGPLDLFYSYTEDFGDTYYTQTKTIKSDSKGNHGGEEVVVWDWLAKDTGQKKAAQAECQIRMTPDGSIFYSVWNETGEEDSDVIFRRIMRDGGDIQSSTTTEDITNPKITISGVSDGDVTGNDVSIDISLNETGTWTADLDKDGEDFVEFESTDAPYTIPADDNIHIYTLKVNAEDSSGNTSSEQITFTIDGRVPKITVTGVKDGELTKSDKIVEVTATGDNTTISLIRDGELVSFSSGDTLSQDGGYVLTVTSINTEHNLIAKETVDFIIDKVVPNITITGIANSETYTKAVTPIISVNDNHSPEQNITVITQLNDSDFISGTTVSDKQIHKLKVTATDEAGNENTLAYTFTIKSSSTNDRSSSREEDPIEPEEVIAEINYSQTTEITTEDSKLNISIPAGATPENSVITIISVEEGVEPAQGMIRIGDMTYQIEVKDERGNNITQFNQDLVLEFSYRDAEIPQEIREEDLKICYWDEEMQIWIAIPTKVDTLTKRITALTDHLTIYAVMLVSDFPELTDIKGHWAEKDVYKLVSMKIVYGDPSGRMRPEDKISREEFTKLLVLGAGLEPESNPVLTFDDTDEIANWARGYVSAAVKAGMISGYEDNTFKPKKNVSRAEIALMIVKALKKQLSANQSINIKDAKDIPEWALPYIAKAIDEGIMSGFPDGTFRSHNNATRAQSAVIISRMIDKICIE